MSALLSREEFAEFFLAVRGHAPFAWQERLLDHLLTAGRWPDAIDAPTGSGKTAVIDIHVFANALSAADGQVRVPRRMSVVVNRRLLVDSHDQHAAVLAQALQDQPADQEVTHTAPVLSRVAHALRLLVSEHYQGPPLAQVVLRGGLERDPSWRVEPEVCTVLTCTPDMWGSRLLMRGYGTSRRARPQEAGLLAYDNVVVVDEAHLSRQLVFTARRVAQVTARNSLGLVPGLQVVDTTATPASQDSEAARSTVGVSAEDLESSEVLRARMTRPKPVNLVPIKHWDAAAENRTKRAKAAAKAVHHLRDLTADIERAPDRPRTVGCILNRVDDAIATASELSTSGLSVVLVTGRMRPHDRAEIERRYPTLLTSAGDDRVDVVVATQTIEVGLDLDLAGVVTDLAPASALAQRTGRSNRLGKRASGPVTVLVPDAPFKASEKSASDRVGVYAATDLARSWQWLNDLAQTQDGMAPWVISRGDLRPQAPTPARVTYQRLSMATIGSLARTSEPAHADPDLRLWLSDDLSFDQDVSVVLRHLLPERGQAAAPVEVVAEILRATPPERHEVVSVRIGVLRGLLQEHFAAGGNTKTAGASAFRLRTTSSEDQLDIVALDPERQHRARLRPGDAVVLDAGTALKTTLARWTSAATPQGDVLDLPLYRSSGNGPLRIGDLSNLNGPYVREAVAAYRDADQGDDPDSDDVEAQERSRRQALKLALAQIVLPDPDWKPVVERFIGLLDADLADVDITCTSADDPLQTLVLSPRRQGSRSLSLTGSSRAVSLQDHQSAVGERAAASASRLGLSEPLVLALRQAGLDHDLGKADERFQRRLGARPGGAVLAKSGPASPALRARRESAAGLPQGWRHEQLSAAESLRGTQQDGCDAELVARLVGTSHGVGRPSFGHQSLDLLPSGQDDSHLVALFDQGGWESLVESTQAKYGVWGCAYLEALLRAADIRTSKDGS